MVWNAVRQLRWWDDPIHFEAHMDLREKVKRALHDYHLIPEDVPPPPPYPPDDDDEEDLPVEVEVPVQLGPASWIN